MNDIHTWCVLSALGDTNSQTWDGLGTKFSGPGHGPAESTFFAQ